MKKLLLSLLIISSTNFIFAESNTGSNLKTVINVSGIGNTDLEIAACASRTGAGGHSCGDWNTQDGTFNYEQSISKHHDFLPAVEIRDNGSYILDGSCKSGPYALINQNNYGSFMNQQLLEVGNSIANPNDGKTHTFSMDLQYDNSSGNFTVTNCKFDGNSNVVIPMPNTSTKQSINSSNDSNELLERY